MAFNICVEITYQKIKAYAKHVLNLILKNMKTLH